MTEAFQEQILDDCDDKILDGSVPNQATARSELAFDVGRVADALRHRAQQEGTQVSLGAAIYLSAVVECISARVLELSGNKAVESNSANEPMITADNVKAGIQGDEELNQVLCAPEWRDKQYKDGSAGDRSQLEEVGLLDPESQQDQVLKPHACLAARCSPRPPNRPPDSSCSECTRIVLPARTDRRMQWTPMTTATTRR